MIPKVRVGTSLLGDGEPCFIIAEAGSNHNRDLGMAQQLIAVAAEAGANAVKFQTYSAETLYSRHTPSFSYLAKVTKKSTWELIKEIELPREWQPELAAHAAEQGILFMSSPFDRKAVDELGEVGVPAYKIASFELVDLDLISYAAQKGKPMILSTGMANLGEIQAAIETCQSVGNNQIVLLHCVSLYPTPSRLANLRAMATMKRAYLCPVGFSDHTSGLSVSFAAAALGADALEKHYTLDRRLPGPDHPFAVEPGELKALVAGVREIESSLGTGLKNGPCEEEREMFEKGRRSVVAAAAITKGTVISRDLLTVKRPGYGVPPHQMAFLIGRKAKVDIQDDQVITWDLV